MPVPVSLSLRWSKIVARIHKNAMASKKRAVVRRKIARKDPHHFTGRIALRKALNRTGKLTLAHATPEIRLRAYSCAYEG